MGFEIAQQGGQNGNLNRSLESVQSGNPPSFLQPDMQNGYGNQNHNRNNNNNYNIHTNNKHNLNNNNNNSSNQNSNHNAYAAYNQNNGVNDYQRNQYHYDGSAKNLGSQYFPGSPSVPLQNHNNNFPQGLIGGDSAREISRISNSSNQQEGTKKSNPAKAREIQQSQRIPAAPANYQSINSPQSNLIGGGGMLLQSQVSPQRGYNSKRIFVAQEIQKPILTEQAMYQAPEGNRTMELQPGEDISIFSQNNNNMQGGSSNHLMFYKKNEQLANSRRIEQDKQQSAAQQPFPQNTPSSNQQHQQQKFQFQQNPEKIEFPSIVANLKRKQDPQMFNDSIQQILRIDIAEYLPVLCEKIRKRVDEKLEQTESTIETIQKEEIQISQNVAIHSKEFYDLQHVFSSSGEYIDNSLSSSVKFDKAIELFKSCQSATKNTLNHVEKQQFLCEPLSTMYRQHSNSKFDQIQWTTSTLTRVRGDRDTLSKDFSESIVKSACDQSVYNQIQIIVKGSALISQEAKILRIIEQFKKEKPGSHMETFGRFLEQSMHSTDVVSRAAKEIDDLVIVYAEQLDVFQKTLKEILAYIHEYLFILTKSKNTCSQFVHQEGDINLAIEETKQIMRSINEDIRSPYKENQQENAATFASIKKRKTRVLEQLKEFQNYSQEQQESILKHQNDKKLPYTLITPLNDEIISYQNLALTTEAKIRGVDRILESFETIENSIAPLERVFKNQAQFKVIESPNLAQREKRILELKKDISTVLEFKDALRLHHITHAKRNHSHEVICAEFQSSEALVSDLYDEMDYLIDTVPEQPVIPQRINAAQMNQQPLEIIQKDDPDEQVKKHQRDHSPELEVERYEYEIQVSRQVIRGPSTLRNSPVKVSKPK